MFSMSLDSVILLCQEQDQWLIHIVMRDRNYNLFNVFASGAKFEDRAGPPFSVDKSSDAF